MSTLKPSPHRTAASTLAQRLRIVAHRGHQVTAKDLATLVRAAALLEEQGAAIDRYLSVYGQTLGELVETRHQLVSIRELLTEALEGRLYDRNPDLDSRGQQARRGYHRAVLV